jgi:8-oxo-dGTP diphosphatase
MIKGVDYTGTAVVFFCHDGKGNYILSKRSQNCRDEHGRWDPGGGGLDFGEKVADLLSREIREEYCTDVLDSEFLGYRDVHRMVNGKKNHWLVLDFRVLVDKSKVANGEPHKFDEIGWFRLDALPSPMHSQWKIAAEKYKDKL